jgi:ABC-type lipoprotein export system ATPase subunit
MSLVEVHKVERAFGSVQILRGVDLTVDPARLIVLYGPSGSGKTTLLNLIGALDYPNRGAIRVCDQDILRLGERQRARLRRQKIGFIFQTHALLPTYTALENIDLALRLPNLGYFERRRRSQAALEAVGLSAWAQHVPEELSGGQRQRVAIARALALRPALLLADEPTSGLDTRMVRRMLNLFREIARTQQTAFILVSHDPLLSDYADQVYDLHGGQLVLRAKAGD